MTFSASVPLSSDSPALLPSQNQDNMLVLKTIISSDHQFNNTPTGGDNSGYHNIIHMIPQSTPAAVPGNGQLYGRLASGQVQLFYMDSAGVEYQVTPKSATNIVAAVNFNGISGASIRGTTLNVSSVNRITTGIYRVNFTNPLSNTNYIVQLTGMRNGGSGISNGQVLVDSVYGNSVKTTSVLISFNGGSAGYDDVLMGNVIIYQPS